MLVAVALVAAACADVTGAALEVNGETFDRSELVDLIDDVRTDLAEGDVALQFELGEGTVPTPISATILSVFIQNEVMGQALRARSIDVSNQEIVNVLTTADPTGSTTFDALQAEFTARLQAVQQAEIDIATLFGDAEVELDPRFGEWLPSQAAVVAG